MRLVVAIKIAVPESNGSLLPQAFSPRTIPYLKSKKYISPRVINVIGAVSYRCSKRSR